MLDITNIFSHDRANSPTRYSLNIEGKQSKYRIFNHVTTQGLSELIKICVEDVHMLYPV